METQNANKKDEPSTIFLKSSPAAEEWYDNLKKPALTPPKIAFPIVWTTLYIMMAAALYFYMHKTGLRFSSGLLFFGIQLALNLAWSPIFFWGRMITFALYEAMAMWVFILFTIISFRDLSQTASYLMMPYLVWVTCAVYLNYYVVKNNPDPFLQKTPRDKLTQ